MSGEKNISATALKDSDLSESRSLFGSDLKNLRIGRNLSLTEVAETTRINSEYITGIEEGNFDRLPGRLFGRGFVSALLKTYGVTDGKMIAAYDDLWVNDGIQRSISDSTKKRLGEQNPGSLFTHLSSSRRIKLMHIVLILFVVTGLAGATYIGYKKRHSISALIRKEKPVKPVQLQIESATPAAKSTAQDADPALTGNIAIASDDIDVKTEEATGKIVETGKSGNQMLSITVIEPVKIKIESDDGRPEIKDLTEGVYNFSFESAADLLIYDAAAVRISFNGNSLGPLGQKGRVRRIGFRADSPNKTSF